MTVRRYPEMNGKVSLVTGGTSGIGLAAAQAFAGEGATVVLTSRREPRAQAALKTFGAGTAVSWIGCDTSDGASVARLIETIGEWMAADPKFATTITGLTPRGKNSTPEEVARSVLFLCSDDAAPILGRALIVDGGALA
jgi:NAD(P)-dependent dehydrogenase (short-subunit alcohol dehydrogenase family)